MKWNLVTCVGVNHLTSPVEEREKLAFGPDELPAALRCLSEGTHGAVLLSTCNRTELYATAPEGEAASLIAMLNEEKEADVDASRFYVLQHEQAVRHLFRVSSGIESMVLGESQILGQVREAMSAATEAGTLNGVLSRAFHAAIAVGKRARTETHIGRHAVSVSSAAAALARKHSGDLSGKTVLVVSAGGMGKLAARSIAAIRPVRDGTGAQVIVANRTAERAEELASEIGPSARGVPLSALADVLPLADVVISGTSAEGFVLGLDEVSRAIAARPEVSKGRPEVSKGRPEASKDAGLLLIDIAVPRDIDPAVRDIPGVTLFDIDDVDAVAQAGLNVRQAEVSQVEAIVEEAVAEFLAWWSSLDVVPVIAALRERAESIRQSELERTLRRLPDLDGETRERIEAMTAAIVKKMLDRPIARLKDGHDKGLYMEALQDLFDVKADGSTTRKGQGSSVKGPKGRAPAERAG